MIVSCPVCETKFNLPKGAIGDDGRRLKCTSCGEVWHQKLEDKNIEAEPPPIKDDEQSIPPSIKPRVEEYDSADFVPRSALQDEEERQSMMPATLGVCASLVLFLVVFAGLVQFKDTIVKSWPAGSAMYAVFGMETGVPGEGLVFDRISAEQSKGMVTVSGYIINLTSELQPIPIVEAYVHGKGNRVLAKKTIKLEKTVLGKEADLPFTAEINGIDGSSQNVHLQFVFMPGSGRLYSSSKDNDAVDH